jgi:hypothetical protein
MLAIVSLLQVCLGRASDAACASLRKSTRFGFFTVLVTPSVR